ncbi:hypothetical protein [Pontiella sulfatireligans]|uniref:Phage integrase SAM-like domain-containing protein n=1 Tax=Pontiella sulfatireligans TaxID=2750658 RepID=A0A6C2UHW8_9BACT|nr:hypothetical protein [Pontiella sulfatireligans]VGO19795.1 hypothetical protein SCARR_01855 [Pontiella sulfatireligans]
MKVADAWEEFCNDTTSGITAKDDTMRASAGYWNAFTTWLGKKSPRIEFMRAITPKDGKAYSRKLKGELATGTYQKHIRLLRLLFDVVAAEARINENPFDGITTKDDDYTSIKVMLPDGDRLVPYRIEL